MFQEDPYAFGAPMAPLAGVDQNVQQAAIQQQSAAPGVLTEANGLGVNLNGDPLKPGFMQPGGMLQMGIGAIGTLGNLWNSFQQNKLAKKSLSLQTRAFNDNQRDQRQTYNTALEDRIRARASFSGQGKQETNSYIEKNKL